MQYQSFAINETEKALKKIIYYFDNGLYSFGKEDQNLSKNLKKTRTKLELKDIKQGLKQYEQRKRK